MNIPKSEFPRVVIIGGGFAGINLAKALANKGVQIVLLDKDIITPFNLFYVRFQRLV